MKKDPCPLRKLKAEGCCVLRFTFRTGKRTRSGGRVDIGKHQSGWKGQNERGALTAADSGGRVQVMGMYTQWSVGLKKKKEILPLQQHRWI